MSQWVAKQGGKALGEPMKYIGSGFYPEDWLVDASREARKAGGILLFAAVDRAVRHLLFQSDCPIRSKLQADTAQLEHYKAVTHGVRSATILDPSHTPEESDKLLMEWSQEWTGRRGGRPANLRNKWGEKAHELFEKGRTCREIAEIISREFGAKISHTGVWKWIQKGRLRSLLDVA
jgi:hypothetical protein